MRSAFVLCVLLCSCGFNPPNGALLCATSGKACPDGYACVDGHCWKPGTAPADLAGTMTPGNQDDMATPLKQNGEACTMGAECSSAVCSDSVCCDRDCSGQCEACNLPATLGMCTNVTGTPVSPRTACGGTGACLGTCDGTKSGCAFPPTSTICGGSCDGKCDGAGSCSGSGGVCPGGYACGVSACKTTCSVPADCQPNFQCNTTTSMCERVPESDCLDGVDNNSDGLVDCADPTCTAIAECVPSVGVGQDIGIVLDSAPCPTNYDAAVPYYGTLQGKPCNGCSCVTNCTTDVHMSNASDCSGSGTYGTITGPVGTVTCTNFGGSYNLSYAFYTSPTPFSCNAGGSASQATPTWGTNKVYCKAHTSASCAANQICVPKPATAPVCARVGSAPACPAGYMTGSNTVYYTTYTPGSCGACGCTKGTNTCGIGFLSSQILDETCGSPNPGGSLIGTGQANCTGITRSPQVSAESNFTMSPSDNCTTSSTNTPPSPTGDTRFCCQ